jgi:hypothetical protein
MSHLLLTAWRPPGAADPTPSASSLQCWGLLCEASNLMVERLAYALGVVVNCAWPRHRSCFNLSAATRAATSAATSHGFAGTSFSSKSLITGVFN